MGFFFRGKNMVCKGIIAQLRLPTEVYILRVPGLRGGYLTDDDSQILCAVDDSRDNPPGTKCEGATFDDAKKLARYIGCHRLRIMDKGGYIDYWVQ
jgi:hypothetical protein